MLDAIITFFEQSFTSLLYGIILLVLALIFLPEHIVIRVLRYFKPDLVSKSSIMRRVRLVLDHAFNLKDVIVHLSEGRSKEAQKRMRDLVGEKKILEGNLFFLDLLKNLTSLLFFSVTKAGYGEKGVLIVLEQAMEYLQYYTQQIEDTPGSQTQRERIFLKAESFQKDLDDTWDYLRKEEKPKMIKEALVYLKQGSAIFDSFMKREYDSTKEQLSKVNQLLADSFSDYINRTS